MLSEYFTEEEANEKIGKKIRSLVDYAGVPSGTTGIVLRTYAIGGDIGLDIRWNLDIDETIYYPLVDGFNKSEYYESLEEL